MGKAPLLCTATDRPRHRKGINLQDIEVLAAE